MRVLVGCEESQIVCKAFRERGHEAYSCDIVPCSGDHPEWHIQDDVLNHLDDGWDIGIFFPPCTYLTNAANRHFINNPDRWAKRLEAVRFVYDLMNADIPKISTENPIGAISSYIRKPDQIIQPFYFGDPERKSTCLWLKNLPKLVWGGDMFQESKVVEPMDILYNSKRTKSGKSRYSPQWRISSSGNPENARLRSKTYPGIAQAMAEQWG